MNLMDSKDLCNTSMDSGINCEDEQDILSNFTLSTNSDSESSSTQIDANKDKRSYNTRFKPPSIRPPPPPICNYASIRRRPKRTSIYNKNEKNSNIENEILDLSFNITKSIFPPVTDQVTNLEEISNNYMHDFAQDTSKTLISKEKKNNFSHTNDPPYDFSMKKSFNSCDARFIVDTLPKNELTSKYKKYFQEDNEGLSDELKPVVMRRKNQSSCPLRRRKRQSLNVQSLSSENELLQLANPMQLDLIKSKKQIERDLSLKLEKTMTNSDNLLGAISKSMNEVRTKDKVKCANKEIGNVIKTCDIFDEELKRKLYVVSISLGKYVCDVKTKKDDFKVKITSSTNESPKFTKTMELQFPPNLEMNKLEIIQIKEIITITVPYQMTEIKDVPLSSEILIEKDPSDWRNRVSFLQNLFQSLNMQWPPEGAGAHFEYLTHASNSS